MIQQRTACALRTKPLRTAVACAWLAVAFPAASVAQVYKCPGAGGTVYQGKPCANDPKAPPHIATPPVAVVVSALPANGASTLPTGALEPLTSAQLSAMDLSGIRRALLADDAERTNVAGEYRAAQLAWQRTAGKADPQERLRQSSVIEAHRSMRYRQIDARDQALNGELARRCPLGARVDADKIECRK